MASLLTEFITTWFANLLFDASLISFPTSVILDFEIIIICWKVFQIGTVRYNWPMSAHASQAFSIAHCTDSEDLPIRFVRTNRRNTVNT